MSRAICENPVARQSRAVVAITLHLLSDSTGQDNNAAGRRFQPSELRAMRAYLQREGWPDDVPDVRFVGSIDSSALYSPPDRYVHDIVSGMKASDLVADLGTRMGAIAKPPTMTLFQVGANDLVDQTVDQLIATYINLCGQVDTFWGGASLPGIITPKDDREGFAINTKIRQARAAVLGGAVPGARILVDTGAFPQTALAADGIHGIGPEDTTSSGAWDTMSRTTNGPAAMARMVIEQAIRPGLRCPIRAGE